jgi:hypothetical protein
MSSRRAFRWALLVVAAAVVSPSFVSSQESLDKIKDKLERPGPIKDTLRDLLPGKTRADPMNAEHVAAINAETEWLARSFNDAHYRNTPPNPPEKDRKKTLAYLIGRVDTDVSLMTRSMNDVEPVAAMYTHYFGMHARGVLLNNATSPAPPVAALNLTRALASLAALGQGELSDVLVDVVEADLKKDQAPEAERVKNPDKMPNDGVKYYALRGLHDLMTMPPKPQNMAPVLTPQQRLKVDKLLVKVITTGQAFKDTTPQQEVDGYRVRRREAIKALARETSPALPDKKAGAALTLLRVVARDKSLVPEPSIEERVEAVLGLARMKYDEVKDYNPDYAAYHIGLFLDEFVTYCNTENIIKRPEGGEIHQRPVRVYASRLIEALEAMRAQANDPLVKLTDAERKFVDEAVRQYVDMLGRLEKSPDSKVNPNAYALPKWLAGAKAPNAMLFKGADDTAVPPPAKKQ